jgi:hypothetical protein
MEVEEKEKEPTDGRREKRPNLPQVEPQETLSNEKLLKTLLPKAEIS